MRAILGLIFMIISVFGGDIVWQTSYKEAVEKAKNESNPMVLFMNQPGCGACEYMKKNVLSDPQIVEYLNAHYVAVSLDIHKNDAPEQFQVKVTPVFHFVRGDGSIIQPTLIGGKTAPFFIKLLIKADEAQ